MRLGVTGGRNYADAQAVASALAPFGGGLWISAGETVTLVYGCATGADTLASAFAIREGWKLDPHHANWPKCGALCPNDGGKHRKMGRYREYCPLAGHLRNQAMVDSVLDVLVAFPGGKGTADMTRRARKAGVRIVEVA